MFGAYTDLVIGAGIGAALIFLWKKKGESNTKDLDSNPNITGEGFWLRSADWTNRRKARFAGKDSIGFRLLVEGIDGYRWVTSSSLRPASFEEFLKNPSNATFVLETESIGGKTIPRGLAGVGIQAQEEMQKVFEAIGKEQELAEIKDTEENKTLRAQHIQAEQANQIAKVLPKASAPQFQSTR